MTAQGAELETEYQGKKLDVYDGQNYPGQPWKAYRSRGFKEKDQEKNLEKHMTALLEKSTTVKEMGTLPYLIRQILPLPQAPAKGDEPESVDGC